MDFPGTSPSPALISSYGINAAVSGMRVAAAQAPAAYAWPTANIAVFMPVMIPWAYPVTRVWWVNGSTASSNVDFGIYTADGTKLYSTGSTAQSGASLPQFVVPGTPFLLSPGAYYFAWAVSGTTGRAFGNLPSSANMRSVGCLQLSSALPLPATMSGAAGVTTAGYILCGVSRASASF